MSYTPAVLYRVPNAPNSSYISKIQRLHCLDICFLSKDPVINLELPNKQVNEPKPKSSSVILFFMI
jgi:hypothetical protein